MIPFHCARGSSGCAKCKVLSDEGPKYCLLDLEGRGGEVARPMMQLEWEGEMIWFEYDFLKIFDNDDDALAYAKQHNIEIIDS